MKRLLRVVRNEAGFTLPELLLTVVIMGVITLPLGNLVLSYFQNLVTVQDRSSVSHDEQISASYFSQDVASVGQHNTDGSTKQSIWTSLTGAPINCSAGITPFLVLAWDEHSSTGAVSTGEAVYGTRTYTSGGRSENQLVRAHCASSNTTPSSPDSFAVLAHNLTATPTLTCNTTCTASATLPTTVSITLQLRTSGDTGSVQSMKLTGQRRQT